MLNEKEFRKLCGVIYRRTGIAIEDKKFNILSKKIVMLMQKKGFSDFRSFFHSIRFDKDKTIFQELVNLITVNETYFFREKYQFDTLVDHVLPKLHKIRPANESIRILCAPSSTGEEPYTIALSLLDEGKMVEQRDFEIVGIDIDSKVIQKAKRGSFTQRSVQFIPPHLLRRYFKKDGLGYEIDGFLKDVVDFKVINIMDKFAFKRLGKFDVIFSRNMLIYFDDLSRKEVAMNFYNSLKVGGFVFLGHAESMNRIVSVFKTVKLGDSIIYQKG
jgi:chemotaxis protein methyltransferase CheR